MKKFYIIVSLLALFLPKILSAQPGCSALTASFTTYESRCASTGAIKVVASGGSGAYKYRVFGPVNWNFTTTDSITGLPAGTYSVEVVDINSGCNYITNSVQVAGSYADPRYNLKVTDVSCDNGSNGGLEVTGLQYGRQPFTFQIIAPSPMGVGTSNNTGIFPDLIAGNYTIQLKDSCGGIQTRSAVITNYNWKIDYNTIVMTSCINASGFIKVSDSRGNVSNTTGIPGMQYGILNASGDTIWSSNPNISFDPQGMTTTKAFAKDVCGVIKATKVTLSWNPSVGGTVLVDDRTCTTFRATVQAIKDMYLPQYKLYDKDNNLISTNNTGVFPNLPYGDYTIEAIDGCTGNSFTRTVSAAAAVVSVDAKAQIYQRGCNWFSVRITGQKNTTNPVYKLLDEYGNLVSQNSSGQFASIPYGKYCIEMKDGCIDTTITRCFEVAQPAAKVNSIIPSYITCTNFGFTVRTDSLLNGANFCLYDNLGNLITCNTTGRFDSIPLGDYCVKVEDVCSGRTFTRCVSVTQPTISNDLSVNLSKLCTEFTATVTSTNVSKDGGLFSLFKEDGTFISSNTSGVFSNLPYGDYYVTGHSVCPDTTFIRHFTAGPDKPSGTGYLSYLNKRCDLFDIQVGGISHLINPLYTVKNSFGDIVYSGTETTFKDLPYGNYCVEVKDGCYDTTITVCGGDTPPPQTMSASFYTSCNYGYSRLNVSASVYPVTVRVMNPSNVMVTSRLITAPGFIDSIPGLPLGEVYTIYADWSCGQQVSTTGTPVTTYLNRTAVVQQFCPGALWPDGYGNIKANVTTNGGTLDVKIIKKDNNNIYLSADYNSGSTYDFNSLGPGTYIMRSIAYDGCNVNFYDTVTIQPYQYPVMKNASAFQCDANGFSIGAGVVGGLGTFTYEIMSSVPETPSIETPPQNSPVFNIDNGTTYELIRLRAIDECGNATLGDASVLPLANNQIRGVTNNCLGSRVTLSVDTVINSVVTWSYKVNQTDPTAKPLGNGFSLELDPFTTSDIGYYYCEIIMNNGCVVRTYEFHLQGNCFGVLPVLQVNLTGKMLEGKSVLEWTIENSRDLKAIFVERNIGSAFEQIGSVNVNDYKATGNYKFIDDLPGPENQYRLKFVFESGKIAYSKVVRLTLPTDGSMRVYPNPATDYIMIDFGGNGKDSRLVEFISVLGQKTISRERVTGNQYTLQRTSAMSGGLYLLKVTNLTTGKISFQKVVISNRK